MVIITFIEGFYYIAIIYIIMVLVIVIEGFRASTSSSVVRFDVKH